ncbi:hypothetical protein AABB24_029957, partial [Solanum stoloniferum]
LRTTKGSSVVSLLKSYVSSNWRAIFSTHMYLLCYSFSSSGPSWVAVCINVHGKGASQIFLQVLPLYSMKNTCRNIMKFAYVSSVAVESTCCCFYRFSRPPKL